MRRDRAVPLRVRPARQSAPEADAPGAGRGGDVCRPGPKGNASNGRGGGTRMSRIRILPEEISNRIAAGEVIERPASVVKELLENALDAGAERIQVRTRRGGRALMQVTDDGCGMDRDDAMLSIEAHATSKIRDSADIDRITTLGFRGEALPSISAVSRFELQSRREEDVSGIQLLVEGGTLRDVSDCGCAAGTSVSVRHLFYNMPARRKFLRTPQTENGHIQEAVLINALAHPGVAFELTLDGQSAVNVTRSAEASTRIAMLLGREVFSQMIPVDYQESDITVRGFVARPGLTRATRREQRLFINGRPAQANTLYYAIRDAYSTLVMKGRFPVVVLYLDLPPERVDVNVHPAKREVRFRDSRLVGQVTAAAVRRALRGLAGTPQPAAGSPEPASTSTLQPFAFSRSATQGHLPLDAPPMAGNETSPNPSPEPSEERGQSRSSDVPPTVPPPASGEDTTAASPSVRNEIENLRVLGTVSAVYLLAEGPAGLVLIDQHAAHERIMFERLLAAARDVEHARQALLLPVTVDFTPADATLMTRNAERFRQLGFGIEDFGGNTFLVTAVPAHFPQENVAGLLRDVLDDLRDRTGTGPGPDEIRVAQAACRHAVRGENPLQPAEVDQLLQDLAATDMPYTCPHGRPVMIHIPFSEIQKRFGRRP